ncbi:MAG: chromosome condensation regulator RCC1 [Pseudomonadota bacterium]
MFRAVAGLLVLCGCGAAKPPVGTCSVRAISAGAHHTCVLTAEGGVRCWGLGRDGQLGDGARADRASPPAVDVFTGAAAVGAGAAHTCLLTAEGGVRCWGLNGDGQLGDGTLTARTAPGDEDVLTGVKAIAVGAAHTCALLATGGVRCWGRNHAGQLGDGTTTGRATPPPADVLTGVKAIAAGGAHTCALLTTGQGGVRCWGLNVFGQLGDGMTDGDRSAPPPADAIADVRSVSAGDAHTCVVTTAGGVRCWGRNADGELGDGTYDSIALPPSADVLTGATAVAAGLNFTCALLAAGGGVRCWGYNSNGQLGDDTELNVDRLRPPDADVLGRAAALAVGAGHTCALMASGGVRCWGANADGQVGDGRAPADSMFPPGADLEGPGLACP